jgi:hypothetical protein
MHLSLIIDLHESELPQLTFSCINIPANLICIVAVDNYKHILR